jgi:thiol-disulfide isomerase/thioredoxin
VADSLSTAAQKSPPGDKAAFNRLTSLEKQLASAMPAGSNLPGYVTFREIQADYAIRSAAKANDPKLQEYYLDRLAKFVQAYPRADDTPDVLLQLGLTNEILSKEVEAKSWYNQVVRNFADKPQAAKARGALARLELEGKPLQLAGPTLQDPNVAFDVEQLRGKVVVVYYWASWNTQAPGEFARLKALLDANKGVALVSVNLDNTLEEARGYLQRAPAPGTHLFQAGGLEGKLATDYGIQALPTMFLVGKDGKVVSRNMQIGNLEEEVKKQLK